MLIQFYSAEKYYGIYHNTVYGSTSYLTYIIFYPVCLSSIRIYESNINFNTSTKFIILVGPVLEFREKNRLIDLKISPIM